MKKTSWLRKGLAGAVTAMMLLQSMIFTGIGVSAADGETVKTLGSWYTDSVWTIENGSYPITHFDGMVCDESAVHTLSYKIKAATNASNLVHIYGDNFISLCDYYPGEGFEGAHQNSDNGKSAKFSAKTDNLKTLGKWYTVETEWCAGVGNQYMKYTIKDEDGAVLAQSDKIDGMWKDIYYAEYNAFTTGGIPTGVYVWNESGQDVQVKDIIITEAVPKPSYGEMFKYTFDSADSIDSRWERAGDIVDGAMRISPQGYPYLNLGNLASDGYYEFSYKVKADDSCAKYLNVYESGTGQNINFGQYNPGTGIGVDETDLHGACNEDSAYLTANRDGWYTIKVAFSAKEGASYVKYTVLDGMNNELYTKIYNEIKALPQRLCFWNEEASETVNGFYYIDDVTLTRLEEPSVGPDRVLIDEKFDSATYGNEWTDASNVTVDNGALKFNSNGYIYFNIPDKVKTKVYRITYDIKQDTVTDAWKLGSLYMYGENNSNDSGNANPNPMSMFSTKNGLYHELDADKESATPKYAVGKGKLKADKWYTAEIEFSESGGPNNSGFIRMNLFDKQTGRAMGDEFEVDLNYAADQPNKTQYCIWSFMDRIGGAGQSDFENPAFYIDNFKVEELDMVYKRMIMRDFAGRDVTAYTGITPTISAIELLFSAPVDMTSAETGITLKKSDGTEVSFTGETNGNRYILNLASSLAANTEYILSISKTVHAAEGSLTLTEPVTIQFRTGAAQTAAAVTSFAPEVLSAETDKITVNAAAYNADADTLNAVVIAAFYKGDGLANVETADLSVSAGEGKKQSFEFKVPDDIGITSAKLFIWDGFDTMIPYDVVHIIPRSAE